MLLRCVFHSVTLVSALIFYQNTAELFQKVHERFEKVQRCFGKISALTQESLNGIRTVKAFAQEETLIKRMHCIGNEYVDLNRQLSKIQTALGPTLDFVT